MQDRVKDKIDQIEEYLKELETIVPASLEEYKEDLKTKAACERYAQKIIESLVDLAYLVVKSKNLRAPEDEEAVFFLLAKESVISEELAKKLKEAKGMRNILVHEYGEVDDAIVFHSISEELVKDSNAFIEAVKIN